MLLSRHPLLRRLIAVLFAVCFAASLIEATLPDEQEPHTDTAATHSELTSISSAVVVAAHAPPLPSQDDGCTSGHSCHCTHGHDSAPLRLTTLRTTPLACESAAPGRPTALLSIELSPSLRPPIS